MTDHQDRASQRAAAIEFFKYLSAYLPKEGMDCVQRVYEFVLRPPDLQSGELPQSDMLSPLALARLACDLNLDAITICAALLLDPYSNNQVDIYSLNRHFGTPIAEIVRRAEYLRRITTIPLTQEAAASTRKITMAFAAHLRVLLLALANLTIKMRNQRTASSPANTFLAQHSMYVYAPIARGLRLHGLARELEDLSFAHLFPDDFKRATDKWGADMPRRIDLTRKTADEVRLLLGDSGLEVFVTAQLPHIWSYHDCKSKRSPNQEDETLPIGSIHIATISASQCYSAISQIHAQWKASNGSTRDRTQFTRKDEFTSIRALIQLPDSDIVEVYIESERPKEPVDILAPNSHPWDSVEERLGSIFDQLLDAISNANSGQSHQIPLDADAFPPPNRVYAFYPMGGIAELPPHSTPIDFAYSIHTDIGDTCTGARVNGVIVPLKFKLRTGDTVEIVTKPGQIPSREWLEFAVTPAARIGIRDGIRKNSLRRMVALGEELFASEFRHRPDSLRRLRESGEFERRARVCFRCSPEELLLRIGTGQLPSADAAAAILYEKSASKKTRERRKVHRHTDRPVSSQSGMSLDRASLVVEGAPEITCVPAKCCRPMAHDAVVGIAVRGQAIRVHRTDCEQIRNVDEHRRVTVRWH